MSPEPLPSCEFDSSELVLQLQLTVTARIEAISDVVDRIMGMVRDMKCAAGKEFEVETSLQEALANAVIHGCRLDATQSVQCCVACDKSRGILIVVRDPGQGFDPHSIPSPIVGQNIFSTHGRGIYLINQLMDEVRYLRGGTEIHMRKR